MHSKLIKYSTFFLLLFIALTLINIAGNIFFSMFSANVHQVEVITSSDASMSSIGYAPLPILMLIFIASFAFIVFSAYFFSRILKQTKHTEKLIFPILIINLAVGIITILSFSIPIPAFSDYNTYLSFANSLINGQNAFQDYASLFPHVYGYSSFLSVLFWLFGNSAVVFEMANVVLSVIICLLTYLVAKEIFNTSAALWASLIISLFPSHILHNTLPATEPLHAALMLFVILTALKAKSCTLYALTGILTALMNAVRPTGYVLLAAIIIYILSEPSVHKLKKTACFCTLIIVYFLSCIVINAHISQVINKPVAASPTGYTLYIGANADSGGTWTEEATKKRDELYIKNEKNAQKTHNELFKLALNRFYSNGIRNIRLLVDKNKNMWCVDADIASFIGMSFKIDPGSAKKPDVSVLLSFCDAFYFILLFLFGTGLFLCIKKNAMPTKALLLLMIILGDIGMYTFVEVIGRYHYEAVLVIIILTSSCIRRLDTAKNQTLPDLESILI